ncbi:reverse transcriptase domain-containing protein [Tanacetum coccineum]
MRTSSASKEDTVYQRLDFTRIRVCSRSNTAYPAEYKRRKWTTPTLLWKSKSGIEKKKILRMHGKVYNWETATISFDESDDEDYTVIYDKNSFSYKIFSVDDLKTDLENGNDKVNMPSFPSPKPTVNYFDDLDYFKVFEREFPAIVYNDGLTSNLDFLTEPTVSPQHIDEFNLKDETSLSECDEEEQNVANKASWNEGIDSRQTAKSAGIVTEMLETKSRYCSDAGEEIGDADVFILRQVFVLKIERGEIIERGKLKVAGFSDPRLRTMDRKMYCETCMANMADCPSHFGHIELAKPMVHIGFMKTVLSCLKPSLQMR